MKRMIERFLKIICYNIKKECYFFRQKIHLIAKNAVIPEISNLESINK
ncbi:MAG: hypothetical protein LHV68_12540 [Elusimicrobia bacterium]|nr:hypothetical protein [Candidatus Liberimonas magnetica]